MIAWTDHLVIAPIAVPMIAGAAMILAGERRRRAKVAIGLASTLLMAWLAAALISMADGPAVHVYRLGGWPSQFGIVLVLDRLSAMMLALSAALGLATFIFSLGRWDRAGVHFQPLLQFQLMGLNGAFLTGDLFNLFVFFEVMLAASYGMALHGSGVARVRAGMHYLVVNLLASLLFLVGVSVVYGIAGTLNMADLSARLRDVAAEDRGLLETGLAVMGMAYLVKAAMRPLGFWLVPTYAAASAPAAAILSILSKVGIYAVLRVYLLLIGAEGNPSTGFGAVWLMTGGLLTIGFGTVAALAAQNLARLAGACVMVSSGTLLTAIGSGQVAVTAGALFYMASSVLAIGAFFLLIELLERGREVGADVLAVTRAALGATEVEDDPEDQEVVGVAIPGTVAILGLAFMACALLLAGLPPLSGFLAKFAILAPLLGSPETTPSPWSWVILTALILSGLACVIAMARTGIDVFWAAPAARVPRVGLIEVAPVALLLALCAALTVGAGPAMAYLDATAAGLHAPAAYLQGVLAAGAGR